MSSKVHFGLITQTTPQVFDNYEEVSIYWCVWIVDYFLGYFFRLRKYEIGIWIASKSCKLVLRQQLNIEINQLTLT